MLHYQGGEVSPKNTLERVFSTMPINPVSLASHLTISETNQVEKNAKGVWHDNMTQKCLLEVKF